MEAQNKMINSLADLAKQLQELGDLLAKVDPVPEFSEADKDFLKSMAISGDMPEAVVGSEHSESS